MKLKEVPSTLLSNFFFYKFDKYALCKLTQILCKNKNRLKCYKLKLLLDTDKVSGWHIKQLKRKVESKKVITNININL